MTKRSFYHSRSNTMTDRTNREKAHDVLQTVSEKSDADTVALDREDFQNVQAYITELEAARNQEDRVTNSASLLSEAVKSFMEREDPLIQTLKAALGQDYSVEAEAEFRESLKRAGIPADAELRFIHL